MPSSARCPVDTALGRLLGGFVNIRHQNLLGGLSYDPELKAFRGLHCHDPGIAVALLSRIAAEYGKRALGLELGLDTSGLV
jgi:hypothetical protein